MKHLAAVGAATDEQPPVAIDWQALIDLSRRITVDVATGDLIVANGAARIRLGLDGTVRIEATRIFQSAERGIRLEAATIDLN